MNSTLTFTFIIIILLSGGTQLSVLSTEQTCDCEEDHHHHHHHHHHHLITAAPSIQVFSVSPSQDAGRHLLVCLVSGLTSPLQDVLWWVDDTAVTSASTSLSEEEGGAYRATSVWEVLAADWRSGSVFRCGTVQEGRVYRRRLCPHDRHGPGSPG